MDKIFLQQFHYGPDGSVEAGMVVGPFDTRADANYWAERPERERQVWEFADVVEPW